MTNAITATLVDNLIYNIKFMEVIDQVFSAMKKAGKAVSAGQIVELTGIERKEVDKVMKKLKTEGKIVSPKNCFWEPAK